MEDIREMFWKKLFPEKPVPTPYIGAVDDYAGILGKLSPEGAEIDIDKILQEIEYG